MANMNFDPTFEWAQIILSLTVLVGLWQLFYHGIKLLYRQLWILTGKEASPSNAATAYWETTWLHQLLVSYLIPFLRYMLATIYVLAVLLAVSRRYPVFKRKITDFDQYLASFTDSLILQLLVIGTAALLWCYASGAMRRSIPWGMFVIGLDVVAETVWQFFRHPVFHWLQVADFFMTGLVLLVIPWAGFFIFNRFSRSETVITGTN